MTLNESHIFTSHIISIHILSSIFPQIVKNMHSDITETLGDPRNSLRLVPHLKF